MQARKRRCWKSALLIAAVLPVASGCTRVSNINSEQVFEYELWAPLTALLVGLVATPVGWALRRSAARLGWSMILFGPIAVGIVAPSMFFQRVVVGHDRFEVRNGMWWAGNVRSFRFAEIDEIGLTAVTTIGRRGSKRTNRYLDCHDKSGRSNSASIDSAVARAAAGAILREAIARGIRIRGRAGDGLPTRGGTGGRDW